MPITVVATPGSASANSFVTEAEADAYLATRLNSSAWVAGGANNRAALLEATREISALGFAGHRVDALQALSWPRYQADDPDAPVGTAYFAADVVPERVKRATYELALEFLRLGTTDLLALPSSDGVISKTVDVLSTTWAQPSERARGLARFPAVMRELGPLLTSSSQPRLVR